MGEEEGRVKIEARPISGRPVRCSNRQCSRTADVRVTITPGYTMMNYCNQDYLKLLERQLGVGKEGKS